MVGPSHFDCPKCGHRYYEPQRFCVECGLDFREAFKRCPKCKKDTPSGSERCINCDFDFEAYEMRRPKYIAGGIVLGIIIFAMVIPYWWSHTPLGKKQGTIIIGEGLMNRLDEFEYVPMFYEYQSGTRSIRNSKPGGKPGFSFDPTKLLPIPGLVLPSVNLKAGEKVYILSKTRDGDGNLWYHVRRDLKDVIRDGWVLDKNIEFE